jgi:hypothetical protein
MSKSLRAKLRKIRVLSSYVSILDPTAQARLDAIARLSDEATAELDAAAPPSKSVARRWQAQGKRA